MKIELDPSPDRTLERKIKMHEVREAIIDRLADDLPRQIDLERFLNVVVSEIGRMIGVDRCDLLRLDSPGVLRISHEWRASPSVPESKGTVIPFEGEALLSRFDVDRPIKITDTSKHKDPTLRFFAKALETRSLLIIPIMISHEVIGLLGLHDTQKPREWEDEEVEFLRSTARQLAIGYQYTSIFVANEKEASRTRALLEIANMLNSHSNFDQVADGVLERAISLVGADYSALGLVDPAGETISLASFKSAEGIKPGRVMKLVEKHGRSIRADRFPAIRDLLQNPRTVHLNDQRLPLPMRFVFNKTMGGKAALVSPVRVGGRVFALLGFVWGKEDIFADHDIALVEGIADQIGTALERDSLSSEVLRLRTQLDQKKTEIVGQAGSIRQSIKLALSVADTDSTVLVQGESGTGKELLANLIHVNSGRNGRPYIKINCGAIPETLLESELFGHEKGAFTDARAQRRGKFEEADGGTLFLDEVGEMSPQAQVRLLRVLQDGEFTRVGGNTVIKVDVRVIAATNSDLEAAIEDGRFRKDLYYRLSVFPITLPPLRDRIEDVQPLVFHFIDSVKAKTGRSVSGISRAALDAMYSYDWPGNIRELENTIERAVIIAAGRQIEPDHLPPNITEGSANGASPGAFRRSSGIGEGSAALEIPIPSTMDEIERIAIDATLDFTGGDKSRASRLLKIGRKTLYRKIGQAEQAGDADSNK